VGAARVVPSAADALLREEDGDARDVAVSYEGRQGFEAAARALGAFREWKAGVPRTGYAGGITLRLAGGRRRVFLVPADFLRDAQAAARADANATRRKLPRPAKRKAGRKRPAGGAG
jgi:hypothetical protein